MELIVLGKYGPYPPENGACSAYLARTGQQNILFDSGSGAVARLQRYIPLRELSCVFLSHGHADHAGDLGILLYAWQQLMAKGEVRDALRVYGPNREDIPFLVPGVSGFRTLTPGETVALGDDLVRCCAARHPLSALSYRLEAQGSALCYSGDTNDPDGLLPLARKADLLLCDGGIPRARREERSPHMSPWEAGIVARFAGVGRLLVTHLHPDTPEEQAREEAAENFPNAQIANEMEVYRL